MVECTPGASSPLADELLRDLAPTGQLRVALNLGNTALVRRGSGSTELHGIAIEIATCLARETSLPLVYQCYASAGELVKSAGESAWDLAFLAIDPARGAQFRFTDPYVHLEGCFIVHSDSALADPDQLDFAEANIGVTAGSAYDLFLSRKLKFATLERYPTSTDSLNALISGRVLATAGIKDVLDNFLLGHSEFRMLTPPFMRIAQGIALPITRDTAAVYVREFLKRRVALGRVVE